MIGERLLQEQHRPGGDHPEQLHGRGGDQLGLAAGAVHVHLLRLRGGHPGDRGDWHPVGSERHRRLQVRREQADRRLHPIRAVADQDRSGDRPGAGQLRGLGDRPRQPRRRHAVHLPAPVERLVHATVSTHIALNTDQTGTYTYDDTSPALDYSGNWSHVSGQSYTSGDYDQTESFSDTAGDSMSVTFTAQPWSG